MREDLLHFIWKYKKLQLEELRSSKNETIQVLDVGTHNLLSGPDFFNAKIRINGQLWAGTVEMHLRSSDWYAHHHERDPNYNNVILHVVWDDDLDVFRSDNSSIPTLVLKKYISLSVLEEYQKLFHRKEGTFINCGQAISRVDDFIVKKWLERLYFERLEQKSNLVQKLLKDSNNDWEQVFFIVLCKNFGLKINGESFFDIARALDFSMIRKIQANTLQMESVLFGLAGFLSDEIVGDHYQQSLTSEYNFLKSKFNISGSKVHKVEFFKLRPSNFPTIRLSQLANLYSRHHNLFSKAIGASSLTELYELFNVAASPYWDNHFTFGKVSRKQARKLSKKFVHLLVLNTILPIKLSYAKYIGNDISEELLQIVEGIPSERNNIISKFGELGLQFSSAMPGQAVLQLYNEYCTQNKCLHCAVGHQLLNRKS
ncbi:MAG: DUF2851 family protein [Arenibacter sp.]|nr:DUF2851 family protein [Arenibacter sp.]